jgi:hypothetical protein
MPNPIQQFAEAKAPPRNKLMGLVADALTRANEFATMQDPRYGDKRQNQTLGILADVFGLGSIAKTADRLSYGDPLTNAKKANVPFLKPETADALMMAPLSPRTAIAAMGMGMGDNALTRAATVWHGSPHKFDKFDASKIGTGEGAQAYGHGLYLAQSPKVARDYQRKLSDSELLLNGKPFADQYDTVRGEFGEDVGALLQYAVDNGLTPTKQMLRSYIKDPSAAKYFGDPAITDKSVPAFHKALKVLEDAENKTLGNLYKVDLPDEKIARMLDWDKPLSQQSPEVQKAALKLAGAGSDGLAWIKSADAFPSFVTDPEVIAQLNRLNPMTVASEGYSMADPLFMTGKDLHYSLGGRAMNSSGNGEKAMRAAGIPGIRYLDGGSRGAGAGSSNYVVFPGEEEALKILERNGIPVR